MSKPYKSVFVPEDTKDEFDKNLAEALEFFDMNYSEFSRACVMIGELLEKNQLSTYLAREARKTGNYRYLILAVEVEK